MAREKVPRREQSAEELHLTTAQEAFAALMRDHVGPVLRARGLRGSAGTYVVPAKDHWASVGFQRSVHSDRSAVAFTVNLTVASKHAWAEMRTRLPYLPGRPAPNTIYGASIWQHRIGRLLPSGEDMWWTVGPKTNLSSLAASVVGAIETYALPAIRSRLGEEG